MVITPALKATIKFLVYLAGLNTLYFGWILVDRLQLPYNEAGRYDDPATGVVYDQQAIIAIAVMFIMGLALTIGLIVAKRKYK